MSEKMFLRVSEVAAVLADKKTVLSLSGVQDGGNLSCDTRLFRYD